MKVWFLISQKGGATKTTLATNLAVVATSRKEKVLIVDTDPQEHSVMWWQDRESDDIRVVKSSASLSEVSKVMKIAKEKGYTLVIFDTAGQDRIEHNDILQYATLCIVPCQTSVLDIRAVKSTVRLLEELKKEFCFVVTRCPSVAQDKDKTRNGLAVHGSVCPTPTIERKAYKSAYAMGMGVTEYDPKDKASDEMKAIYKWITNKERKKKDDF